MDKFYINSGGVYSRRYGVLYFVGFLGIEDKTECSGIFEALFAHMQIASMSAVSCGFRALSVWYSR